MDDRIEQAIMNSRVREWFMKGYEFPIYQRFLRQQQINLTGGAILDAGCGSGYSTLLIQQIFAPDSLHAFDISPEEVKRVKQRGLQATVFVGDLAELDLPDAAFDAVFTFGVLHHLQDTIGDSTPGLHEIQRVLKPGGVLLGSEPYSMRTFNFEAFTRKLAAQNLTLLDTQNIYFRFFVSFICQKPLQGALNE
jgi:ubiquinone/menaquinone biosynthesis C-methylase UbiE